MKPERHFADFISLLGANRLGRALYFNNIVQTMAPLTNNNWWDAPPDDLRVNWDALDIIRRQEINHYRMIGKQGRKIITAFLNSLQGTIERCPTCNQPVIHTK